VSLPKIKGRSLMLFLRMSRAMVVLTNTMQKQIGTDLVHNERGRGRGCVPLLKLFVSKENTSYFG